MYASGCPEPERGLVGAGELIFEEQCGPGVSRADQGLPYQSGFGSFREGHLAGIPGLWHGRAKAPRNPGAGVTVPGFSRGYCPRLLPGFHSDSAPAVMATLRHPLPQLPSVPD